MALCRLLSLVCLLAPFTTAQAYSGGDDLLDVTITKSVTETVTKYLSECGIAPTPFEGPDTTLSGTTTVTSTLQSTISIILSPNGTDVSIAAPVAPSPSPSDAVFSFASSSPSDACTGFNCSTAFTSATPCSTATVVVPAAGGTNTPSLSTTHSVHPTTPVRGTSSTAATTVSPSQIPVSGSTTLRVGAAICLGTLGIIFMLITGFL
ncbi:hypothetical protein F4820DRAFT_121755 [Hypoxylon rubiginosum]|uniref:Uncharacterized protein n=1 Tax=Hypoxylon rubiginosum TaxID=110542 RepID=A0ACB9YMV6_9PEZI|nr:hypothetical protein F4820DRAFT_121755 [Hypoxylon rubiginosum]